MAGAGVDVATMGVVHGNDTAAADIDGSGVVVAVAAAMDSGRADCMDSSVDGGMALVVEAGGIDWPRRG